jgi:hypothetical protein
MALYNPLLEREITPVRAVRVTAGATWAKRAFGVAKRVTFSSTADATCVLAKDAASAESSVIAEAVISAAGGPKSVVMLEDYAGDIFVHTLTATALLQIQYD